MGGEKDRVKNFISAIQGSPPRGRGKVEAMNESIKADRITPAWAGKSLIYLIIIGRLWDHPRVGGEKRSLTNGGFTT